MLFGHKLNSHSIFKGQAKVLIRVIYSVSTGCSEPLLFTHTTLLEISSCGSFIFKTNEPVYVSSVVFANLCLQIVGLKVCLVKYI